MNRIAFIFPGQGSQFIGMGSDIAAVYHEARMIFQEAEDLLSFPITKICWEGPFEELSSTRITQLAVFINSLAVFEVIKGRGKLNSWRNIAVAGHSLGEFSALVAGGVLPFKEGLLLVKKRAELMEAACKRKEGGMLAIIGLPATKVREICEDAGEMVRPANYNAPDQIVVSGAKEGLTVVRLLAQEAGAKRVIPLKVSGAFHSPLMQEPQDAFERYCQDCLFMNPLCDFVSNVTGDFATEPATIKQLLIKQMTNPVHWTGSVIALNKKGYNTFIEIGAGKVLSGLVKKIIPGAQVFHTGDNCSLEKVLALLGGSV